jgi:hypothetical protein
MGTKKKSTTKSSGTTTEKPLEIVMPGYGQIASGVSQGLSDIQGVDYTGDYLAQPGAIQDAMIPAWQQAAATVGGLVPQAQEFINMGMQGPVFGGPDIWSGLQSFGGTNPGGMQGAVNAAIHPYMQQLTQSVLPSLQSAGIESGAYGGTRSQQTLPAMAIADAGESAQRVAAALAYEDFKAQQDRILQGYGLSTERGLGEAGALTDRISTMPGMFNTVSSLAGGQAEFLGNAAQADLMNRQMEIDNELKKFQYDMTRPFMGYDTAANILSQLTQGYGTTDTQSKSKTTEKTGGLGNIVAGGLGLASAAMGMPGGLGGIFGGGASPLSGFAPTAMPQMPIYGAGSITGWDPSQPLTRG